jgi:ABC-type Fe3+/spermidine/putrescine transport system ATPase subunit
MRFNLGIEKGFSLKQWFVDVGSGKKKEKKDFWALTDVSFKVKKGEVISVIGSSGSGKSTMLRCINLLETPTGGKIFFEGKDIESPEIKLTEYRARCEMVFQQFNLFNNMTALDNCVKPQMIVLKRNREEATRIAGGCITGFGLWMPGNCMGQLSEDVSVMLSPEVYEEHFLPALKSCIADCDGAMIHVHSLGHRMIPMFAALERIKMMEISSDPNSERAVDIFRRYREELQDKTVIIAPTYEELAGMEDLLATNKTLIWYYAKDEEDAKRALKIVEKYR